MATDDSAEERYRYVHRDGGGKYNDYFDAREHCKLYCHPEENFGLPDDYDFEEHFEVNEDVPESD